MEKKQNHHSNKTTESTQVHILLDDGIHYSYKVPMQWVGHSVPRIWFLITATVHRFFFLFVCFLKGPMAEPQVNFLDNLIKIHCPDSGKLPIIWFHSKHLDVLLES